LSGLKPILRKELSDHFSSYRFMILFALIAMVGLITVYMAGIQLKESLEGVEKPRFVFLMLFTTSGAFFSLVDFVAFFGPLIGLLLGFDAINRERNQGTLSKLLAQPIYRDTVINAKFLAGVITLAVMMISIIMVITGLGLSLIGVVPGLEELGRICVYLAISIIYISFWLGMAILFSIIFRSVGTSAMATLSAWIFLSFFISIGANILAVAIVPSEGGRNQAAMFK
jgi:ABC-2 type transport system permease protein